MDNHYCFRQRGGFATLLRRTRPFSVPVRVTPNSASPATRESVPFSWYVTCGVPAYSTLAGVRYDRAFRELDAMIETFQVGEPRARELFGPDVRYDNPGWPGISYSHVNCLGAPLTFPEDSEVAMEPIHHSLREGIAALEHEVDWASAGLMPRYLELWEGLKRAFPDRDLPFRGCGLEGPITTAWELRGHDFFTDAYDDPDRYHEYLKRVTHSIADYARFVRRLNGEPDRLTSDLGMCDDISAMISPAHWAEWVLPYQDMYFALQTDGPRHAHIENFVPDHLPFLDDLRLSGFDPSVSPRIRATDLRDRCHVPFWWRLNSMQLRDFDDAQIRHYLRQGVADGASGVFFNIARCTLTPEGVHKVHVFMETAREIESRLAAGCAREQLTEA